MNRENAHFFFLLLLDSWEVSELEDEEELDSEDELSDELLELLDDEWRDFRLEQKK